MKTLEDQLALYGARQRELYGPIPVSELRSGTSVVSVGSASTPRTLSRWLPGIACAAAIALGLSLVILYTSKPPSDSGTTPGEPSPAGVIVGIPPEGATPSDPTPGELVLHWEGNITAGMTWIYADGRVISQRPLSVPEGIGEEFSGLTERRLTPEGVEFLRSEVLATGLFASDLMLAREGDAPFLMIHVANGDRLVGVTWAWRGIAGDAPVATPEQESALLELNALLANPESLPSDLWADRTSTAYVPSWYSVCFGVSAAADPGYWIGPVDPTLVWALLPEPAQDVLRTGVAIEEESIDHYGGCSRVTTDDARALALILQDAGIPRVVTSGVFSPETFWVAFHLSNQVIVTDQAVTGDEVFIRFAPFLPHGEAVWWGPG